MVCLVTGCVSLRRDGCYSFRLQIINSIISNQILFDRRECLNPVYTFIRVKIVQDRRIDKPWHLISEMGFPNLLVVTIFSLLS
jgi:hypothetical protein